MKRVRVVVAVLCGLWGSCVQAQEMNESWWAYQQQMMLREQMYRQIQYNQQQAAYFNGWNRGYQDLYYRSPAGTLVPRSQVPVGGFNRGYHYAGSYGAGHVLPRGH
jgi:hypothetical protein